MSRCSTFRWFITLLTAVGVSLCCCSLGPLISICKPCDSAHATCHASHHDDDAAVTTSSIHDHPDHDPAAPDQSKPGQKDDGCSCGGDKRVGTLEGKSQVTLQPLVLAYTLPEPAALQPLRGLLIRHWVDSQAPLKPDQSLLRQHCALIV